MECAQRHGWVKPLKAYVGDMEQWLLEACRRRFPGRRIFKYQLKAILQPITLNTRHQFMSHSFWQTFWQPVILRHLDHLAELVRKHAPQVATHRRSRKLSRSHPYK